MRLEILFLAWNRLAFTEATFTWLLAHTHWPLVERLVVYDDGSEDGTQEWLREALEESGLPEMGVETDFRVSDLRSPPAVMNHYLATCEADWFCKIDNDIALCEHWLSGLLQAHEVCPQYELIGMEAGMVEMAGRDGKPWDQRYRVTESTHVGGVGLFSVEAIRSHPRIPERGRFGWTEWQTRYNPLRGWITPDLHVPQLDRLPFEPWLTLRQQYLEEGWSREWPLMEERWARPYFQWLLKEEVA
jgi:glycosyltransferase involved in cell wall biosynthesis